MLSRSIALTVALAATTLGASAAIAAPSPASDQTPGQPTGHVAVLLSADARASLVADAQAHAADLAHQLGLAEGNALTVKDVVKDADGATHVRVDRAFKGMRVVGGDLVIHRDASGAVTGHDGTFDGAITVDLTPSVAKADGQTKGLAAAKAYKKADDNALAAAAVAANNLVIFVDHDGRQTLAYQVQTNGSTEDKTPSRVVSYINADSGAVLQTFDRIAQTLDARQRRAVAARPAADTTLDVAGTGRGVFTGQVPLDTTQTGSGYSLQSPTTGNYTTDLNNASWDIENDLGPAGTTFTNSTNTWGNGSVSNRQSTGVDAQYGAEKTFEYYKTVQGRNGIWNNGKGARSRTHYGHDYVNAWWDGQEMTYGDGMSDRQPLTELDVSAHEMSHGVNENAANLDYSGDAGGLNEANSDIFGTAVEWYANLAADKPDYLIGELININGDGKPLRYMDKPSKDYLSPDCWSSKVATLDPHEASGPLNHWYFLASEGSGSRVVNGVSYNSPTCNNSTVTGGGHLNVEKVWYRTLSTKLTAKSTYKDAREGAIASAKELYGDNSQVCKSVEAAFSGIGVPAGSAKCGTGTIPPTTTPPVPPTSTPPVPPSTTVPVPPSTTTPVPPQPGGGLVNGGFEQGTQGWTGSDGPITDNDGRPAHSGSWKMWLGGNGARATETESQTFTVPSGAPKLSYYLAVDTDEKSIYMAFDKTVVTVNGTQVASYSNQDRGYGFKLRTIDLSRWAGQQVTLKFTMNEDSMNQTSFVFDDMSVR